MKAQGQLDTLAPNAGQDLRAVMNSDPSLIGEAAKGRTARALRAMTLQRELRLDVASRANRFVSDWQERTRLMKRLEASGDYLGIEQAKAGLAEMSKSLHRDPQLESLLRNRHKELGIGSPGGASLSQDLREWLARSRSRSRGLGR